MKKIILIILIMLIVSGCEKQLENQKDTIDKEKIVFKEKIIKSENIRNNSMILTINGSSEHGNYLRYDILYEKEDNWFQNYFNPELRDSLDWINENIEEGIFLSWWDYGHMIRGYTGKDVIIYSPSQDILLSLASGYWNETGSGKFSSREKVYDVSAALTTEEPSKTIEIMDKYETDYIFLTINDKTISHVMFKIVGEDLDVYFDEHYNPKEKALSTTLFRMINLEEIESFKLVYADDATRIFKKY